MYEKGGWKEILTSKHRRQARKEFVPKKLVGGTFLKQRYDRQTKRGNSLMTVGVVYIAAMERCGFLISEHIYDKFNPTARPADSATAAQSVCVLRSGNSVRLVRSSTSTLKFNLFFLLDAFRLVVYKLFITACKNVICLLLKLIVHCFVPHIIVH